MKKERVMIEHSFHSLIDYASLNLEKYDSYREKGEISLFFMGYEMAINEIMRNYEEYLIELDELVVDRAEEYIESGGK